MKTFSKTIQKAVLLGAISGMRTNAGLVFSSLLFRQTPLNYFSPSKLVSFFYNKKVLTGAAILGAAELVGDKLPSTPNRTDKGGLAARAVAGAICGATIYRADGKKATEGILIGGLVAVASTYAFFHLRKKICETTAIPDPYVGAAEDMLAIGGGLVALHLAKKV